MFLSHFRKLDTFISSLFDTLNFLINCVIVNVKIIKKIYIYNSNLEYIFIVLI